MWRISRGAARMAMALAVAMCAVLFTQCDQREKVLDVKTPKARVQVEPAKDGGLPKVEVDTTK